MARRFAGMGRDLALVARRTDRLELLRKELLGAHPDRRIEIAPLDGDAPDAVATVIPEPAGRLGGVDRVIANAGIGRGASVGPGKAWASRATLTANVLGTHATCEAAMEL